MKNSSENIKNLDSLREYSKVFYLQVDLKNLNDGIYTALYTVTQNWKIARNWFLKTEWDTRWKVHSNKIIATALKPRGELLINYYRLCERCHAMQDGVDVDIPYKNAGVWFSKIFIELIGIEIDNVLNPPKIYNGNIKKAFIDIDRNKSRLLRSGKNPFIEYVVNKENTKLTYKAQALKILIDCSLELQSESDVFRRKYWNPYLNSYTAHIAEIASSRWGMGFIIGTNGTKYFIQGGQGRGGNGRRLQGTTTDFKKLFFESLIE